MISFGLIIDEAGVPGLYKSVERAKKQVEEEIKSCYGVDVWEEVGYKCVWMTPVDAWWETVSVYSLNDDWVEDYDYQVGPIILSDAWQLY
jgi:hypothetical protein